MTPEDVRRFMLLYRANTRSFGNWDPRSRKTRTEKREVSHDDFVGHFEGRLGIGCVPLRDDDTCYWGAIDIDNHGQKEDSDIKGVEQAVQAAGFPLVACRSKSGGVHLYAYFSEPVRASLVRRVLQLWADKLQVPGTDCLFPKHDRMNRDSESGELGLSNWINFPYFNEANKTDRYAVVNGKPVELAMFLDYSEGKRQTVSDMQRWANADHTEAPPCLQAKFLNGFTPGERNTGVYQIAVYCRKKERDPEAAAKAAHELSEQFMPDIKYGERQKTIKSALTKTYNFKCDEFKDVCDKSACRKRKFGVSESQFRDMVSKESIPKFSEAIMWTGMEDPKWSVKAEIGEGAEYSIKYLSTDELRKYDMFKRKMIEMTPIFLPPIKQGDWEQIIGPVMANRIAMPMPEDVTDVGVIKNRLRDFLQKAKFDDDMKGPNGREPLMRGQPVYQTYHHVDVVMFRSSDFEKFLRDTKTDSKKNLWLNMLENMGAQSDRIRVGQTLVTVWFVEAAEYLPHKYSKQNFDPEY